MKLKKVLLESHSGFCQMKVWQSQPGKQTTEGGTVSTGDIRT